MVAEVCSCYLLRTG